MKTITHARGKAREGSINKSARLVILMELQDAGKLKGLSLQKIANLFPDQPTRATIGTDLKDLPKLRQALKETLQSMNEKNPEIVT